LVNYGTRQKFSRTFSGQEKLRLKNEEICLSEKTKWNYELYEMLPGNLICSQGTAQKDVSPLQEKDAVVSRQ
jgi:hypothetical protein